MTTPNLLQSGGPSLPARGHSLVVIRVGGRPLVVDEVSRLERSGDCVEGDGRMGKVETIGKVVRWSVRVPERGQVVSSLDEFEDAAKVVCGVRNVSGLGIR